MFGLPPVWEGIIAGVLLSVSNTLVGILVANKTKDLPVKKVISAVLGGMTIRLFAMMILVWYCIAVAGLHKLGFALSLVISFFILLMTEIFFFHTTHEQRQPKIRGKRKPRHFDF